MSTLISTIEDLKDIKNIGFNSAKKTVKVKKFNDNLKKWELEDITISVPIVSPALTNDFLEASGIRRKFNPITEKFDVIKINNNINNNIYDRLEDDFKDDYLYNLQIDVLKKEINNKENSESARDYYKEALDLYMNYKGNIIKELNISKIHTDDLKEDRENSYLYFTFGIYHITKDDCKLIPLYTNQNLYTEIHTKSYPKFKDVIINNKKLQHSKDIIDKEFTKLSLEEYKESQTYKFIDIISKVYWHKNEDGKEVGGISKLPNGKPNIPETYINKELSQKRLKSLMFQIGKTISRSDKSTMTLHIDENYSDFSFLAQGGRGKNALYNLMKKFRNTYKIEGRELAGDNSVRFAFSKCNEDHDIIYFDEIPRNFKYETLYTTIDSSITIEKKGKDKYYIEDYRPSLWATSNYTSPSIDEGSSTRRIEIVEAPQFFSKEYTVEEHFGNTLFKWEKNDPEWIAGVSFIIDCVQFFMNNSTMEQVLTTVGKRSIDHNTLQVSAWLKSELATILYNQINDPYYYSVNKLMKNYSEITGDNDIKLKQFQFALTRYLESSKFSDFNILLEPFNVMLKKLGKPEYSLNSNLYLNEYNHSNKMTYRIESFPKKEKPTFNKNEHLNNKIIIEEKENIF